MFRDLTWNYLQSGKNELEYITLHFFTSTSVPSDLPPLRKHELAELRNELSQTSVGTTPQHFDHHQHSSHYRIFQF
jgi:hypothetical protein